MHITPLQPDIGTERCEGYAYGGHLLTEKEKSFMAKVADKYLTVDPWAVVEEGFDPLRNRVSESIFSLGNEYMGVRGYPEEGYSGIRCWAAILTDYMRSMQSATTIKELSVRCVIW